MDVDLKASADGNVSGRSGSRGLSGSVQTFHTLARQYPVAAFALVGILAGLAALPFGGFGARFAFMAVVLGGGVPLTWSTLRNLVRGRFTVDLIATLAIVGAGLQGEFLAAALVVLMQSGGEALDDYGLRRANRSLDQLLKRAPSTALRREGGDYVEVPAAALRSGDILLVRPGAIIAADSTSMGEYDRYNTQRMVTLTANVTGEDLGAVAGQVRQALERAGQPVKGVTVTLRGQITPMEDMLANLRLGLLAAVVVIFLLLAANFQSLRLALVSVATVPAVLVGVLLSLWLTGTTLNVQSFMGAIMAIGVAVANAILLVTFAERSRKGGLGGREAAVEGARSRLRPILMTSAAMIAGMVPMALGIGEGGEQTAPLGRAVIGGLLAATVATLLILPSMFAIVQERVPARSGSLDPSDPESPYFDRELAS